MFETLAILPVSFWLVVAVLAGGGYWSFRHLRDGIGLPMLAVLGTVTAWYVGDAFYNDYPNYHAKLFTAGTLQAAWLQVAWFLLVFLVATPPVHQMVNARYFGRRSGVLQLFQRGVGDPQVQRQLNLLFTACGVIWVALLLIALLILKGGIIYYLFPFLGVKYNPWAHGQIGAGFDCFAILAVYLQLLSATMFGVVAALATDRRVRRQAGIFCLLAWPFFIFDRTRNSMLAMVIPAILSWVFLRLRGGIIKKGLVLLVFFLVVNTWMKFVIANRSHMSITQAFAEKGLNLSSEEKAHNEGLNMFEELCWISKFIDDGTYKVNWGRRYFAELVNPIPRGLWPGKPLIGLGYAIARGHHVVGPNGTVDTTISTGMIGQGVTNFGRVFGPVVAALLMSLWVAWLARLDLNIQALGHLPLYSLGLILTFNLGRDITLITLYPFIFGALIIWWLERYYPSLTSSATANAPAMNSVVRASQSPRPNTRSTASKGFSFAGKTSRGGLMRRTISGIVKRAPNAGLPNGRSGRNNGPDGN